MSEGYATQSGHVHSKIVEGAWELDRESVMFKGIPSIANAHKKPDCFEKMKADLAFQPFGDEVIKELFARRKHLKYLYMNVQRKEDFVKKINRIIRVMTARKISKALKPDSVNVEFLKGFYNT